MTHEHTRALVYISGPYTAPTPLDIHANIEVAHRMAVVLWNAGFGCITPHLNTAHFEHFCPDVPHAAWLEADLQMLESCDAILMLPGWEQSKGALMERDRAYELRLGVYESKLDLELAFPLGGAV